jgi:hypothetical protein
MSFVAPIRLLLATAIAACGIAATAAPAEPARSPGVTYVRNVYRADAIRLVSAIKGMVDNCRGSANTTKCVQVRSVRTAKVAATTARHVESLRQAIFSGRLRVTARVRSGLALTAEALDDLREALQIVRSYGRESISLGAVGQVQRSINKLDRAWRLIYG